MENDIEEIKKELIECAKKHKLTKENLQKFFDAVIEGIEEGAKASKDEWSKYSLASFAAVFGINDKTLKVYITRNEVVVDQDGKINIDDPINKAFLESLN